MKKNKRVILLLVMMAQFLSSAKAVLMEKTFYLDQPAPSSPVQSLNGLSAEAVFTFNTENPDELKIELSNTSTGLPTGFSNADQILTAISFDFGQYGYDVDDPKITSGTVKIGDSGYSIDFSEIAEQLIAGDDVSGEWGYGNYDGTGLLENFVSATGSRAINFTGVNLDGPFELNGPQGGIITAPPLTNPAGLGVITNSVNITIALDQNLQDLDFLDRNGVRAEFGSDAAYVVPEPATIGILGLGCLILVIKRKNTRKTCERFSGGPTPSLIRQSVDCLAGCFRKHYINNEVAYTHC